MFNQKLNFMFFEDLIIDVDLFYEIDLCELKLDEMIEVELELEMIEGFFVFDVLIFVDWYFELFEYVQLIKLFLDSKMFLDCVLKMDLFDILICYCKVRCYCDFDLCCFVENYFWLLEILFSEYVFNFENLFKEYIDQFWLILMCELQDYILWFLLLVLL